MDFPAPFLHVVPPSYRVGCPDLSQGPKLPTHAPRNDFRGENWASLNSTHPGSCLFHGEGRGRGGREDSKEGTAAALLQGKRAVGEGDSGSAEEGDCHPSVLPTLLPNPLQRKVHLPCSKTVLAAVTSNPPTYSMFLSHSCTSL